MVGLRVGGPLSGAALRARATLRRARPAAASAADVARGLAGGSGPASGARRAMEDAVAAHEWQAALVQAQRTRAERGLANDKKKLMMQQFFAMKAQFPDHLLLFRMGDFYECFAHDARPASEIMGIVCTTRVGTSMCGVQYGSLLPYLKKLLNSNIRVAVCEQIPSAPDAPAPAAQAKPAQSNGRGKVDAAVLDREVVRLYSPGTITEEEFLDPGSPTYLTAISAVQEDAGDDDGGNAKSNPKGNPKSNAKGDSFGMARLDMSTGELFLSPLGSAKSAPSNLLRFDAAEAVVPHALLRKLPIFFAQSEQHWAQAGALKAAAAATAPAADDRAADGAPAAGAPEADDADAEPEAESDADLEADSDADVDMNLGDLADDEAGCAVSGALLELSDDALFDAYDAAAILCPALGHAAVTVRPDAEFSAAPAALAALLVEAGAADKVEMEALSAAERAALAGLLRYVRRVLCGRVTQISSVRRTIYGADEAAAVATRVDGADEGAAAATRVMEIHPAALRSLEVLKAVTGDPRGSLLDAVKCTRSAAGARLLQARLKEPSTDTAEINARLDSVQLLLADVERRKRLRDRMGKLRDLHRSLQRVMDKANIARDIATIADALDIADQVRAELADAEAEAAAAGTRADADTFSSSELAAGLARLEASLVSTTELRDRFKRGIFREGQQAGSGGPKAPSGLDLAAGDIMDAFDDDLDLFRRCHLQAQRVVEDAEKALRDELGVTELRIFMRRNGRLLLEVASKHAGVLDALPDKFTKVQDLKGRARYASGALSKLEVELLNAKDNVDRRVAELLAMFERDVRLAAEDVRTAADALAEIDVAASMAHLAYDWNLTRPEVVADPVLEVERGRHLVVEAKSAPARGQFSFTPNPLSLRARLGGDAAAATAQGDEDDGRPGNVWLITGPNMGGKSTFLRQNAHLIILAQAGSFVPAARATLGLVDRLYCRVGASDDLIAGKSTYMLEMEETAAILRGATPRSFVVIDEIGRGTSTKDGCAIAQAVLEALVASGCRTLFATHFHQLPAIRRRVLDKGASAPDAGGPVRYFQMRSFGDDRTGSLAYLYAIAPGVATNSYGVHVARLAGVPDAVIERTAELLDGADERDQESEARPMQPADWTQLSLPQAAARLRNIDFASLDRRESVAVLRSVRAFLERLSAPA